MEKLYFICVALLLSWGILKAQITEPYGNLIYMDSLTFLPPDSLITINNPEQNVWEIGQPQKTFFHAAKTGLKVMVTDSANFYPENCNDYFLIKLPIPDYYWGEAILSFYHKYDTDTLIDGGMIEISYDSGNNWENIKNDQYHIATNFIGLYTDTIKGGENGFSGKSDGWQYVELYWWWVALTNTKSALSLNFDSPVIRFRFKSDDLNKYKEGWMIDDLVLRGYDVGGEISEFPFSGFYIFPNPAADFIQFKFPVESYPGLTISFCNPQGQITLLKPVTQNKIDISFLPSGPYFYIIEKEGKVLKKGTFIKQ
jgi:hypothetical protein